jgi:ribosomal protein S28E/S33
MDASMSNILASTGTAGTVITILFFLYKILNGKRCHSRCCNRNIDAEFKIDDMSPEDKKKHSDKFRVSNPIINIPK